MLQRRGKAAEHRLDTVRTARASNAQMTTSWAEEHVTTNFVHSSGRHIPTPVKSPNGETNSAVKIMNIGYLSRNVEDRAPLRATKWPLSTYDCAPCHSTDGCCIIIRSNWNWVQFRDLNSFKLHLYTSMAPSAGIWAAVSQLWRHLHTQYYYEHLTP